MYSCLYILLSFSQHMPTRNNQSVWMAVSNRIFVNLLVCSCACNIQIQWVTLNNNLIKFMPNYTGPIANRCQKAGSCFFKYAEQKIKIKIMYVNRHVNHNRCRNLFNILSVQEFSLYEAITWHSFMILSSQWLFNQLINLFQVSIRYDWYHWVTNIIRRCKTQKKMWWKHTARKSNYAFKMMRCKLHLLKHSFFKLSFILDTNDWYYKIAEIRIYRKISDYQRSKTLF